MKIFITGIDTNIGKTVVSAIVATALRYDYWKPVQCGDLKDSDTMKVKSLTGGLFHYYPERYRLKEPASPHLSAKLEDIEIKLNDFLMPVKDNIIVEGAGGLMVPINTSGDCIIDIAKQLDTKVILVSKNYLGSINHTLMSCQMLNTYGIQTLGIIINGDPNEESEKIISEISGVPILGHVDTTKRLNRKFIEAQAKKFENILG
jgi:dethiobiotin synthetase